MGSKVDFYWKLCLESLNARKATISLPKAIVNEIDLAGLEELKQRVKAHTKSGVKLQIEDDAVVLKAEPEALNAANSSKGSGSKSGPAKEKKIPRPPNQWILFRQHHHHSVVANNPGMDVYTTSKVIGAMWRDASDEEKASWKAKAVEVARLHRLKYPNYTYAPRKTSEVKRRNTKAKAVTTPSTEDSMEYTPKQADSDSELDNEYDDIFDEISMDVDVSGATVTASAQSFAAAATAQVNHAVATSINGTPAAQAQDPAPEFQPNVAYANMGINAPLNLLHAHAAGFDASSAPHPSLWSFTPQMRSIGFHGTESAAMPSDLGRGDFCTRSQMVARRSGMSLLSGERSHGLGNAANTGYHNNGPSLVATANYLNAQYPPGTQFGFATASVAHPPAVATASSTATVQSHNNNSNSN
ncbi:hypothetical protein P152DRAFT_76648 [Eremomyces bilateralis CBS 781.70]|uniref:HMG box domain-containing protein n=1 Tax=Eremomyces bilateralis CBS 781.70 TaxID=1392243 RepID=A0A6G1FZC7_9PEZI|nr:uncharacterized protein P152DRAFT_76648 [Eremomyces bilateralis CBS 781.70]KAF1811072.1 hypothetical protein P152DRAFT_76648 [Eremomyces bilateralis CBS 781.70]